MKSQSNWQSGLLLAGLSLVTLSLRAPHAGAQQAVSVTVNAAAKGAVIPPDATGVNTAVFDGSLLNAAVPNLVKQAGLRVLRYPGGSYADVYHWQTHTATQGYENKWYIAPGTGFDAFMGLVQGAGATPFLTVNYGSNAAGTAGGDPAEAAAWVTYANVTKGYGVKYWEIGNENYADGAYPNAYEVDLHADHSATAYGTNVLDFITQMKAADPTIKIGIALTVPSTYYDTLKPNWNVGVLAACGSKIDFVDIHWYAQEPGTETDADLLASTSHIANYTALVQSLIQTYCGDNAPNVQIFVGETNSVSYNPGKQTVGLVNALFLADDFATWLENGASSVEAWALHNGISTGQNNSASLYGSAQYGDYGILSSGQTDNNISEPAVDTAFPSYYGLQMFSLFAHSGDALLATTSDQSLLAAHAVKQANGGLALLLINKDPATTFDVNISLAGYTPVGSATVYTYGESSSAIASAARTGLGRQFTQSCPAYSLTTVVLRGTGAGDFDVDGNTDIVWRNAQTGDVALWYMNKTDFASSLVIASAIAPEWRIAATPDLDADGRADILWQNTQTGDLAYWLSRDNQPVVAGSIAQAIPLEWVVAGSGDFDGDGQTDILWQNTVTGDVAVWFLNGVTFRGSRSLAGSVPLAWQAVGTGDFNADGSADIVWRNAQTGDVAVWFLNNGSYQSGSLLAAGVPLTWKLAGVGDYDGDGQADLLWQNTQTGTVAFWLLSGLSLKNTALGGVVDTSWQISGPR